MASIYQVSWRWNGTIGGLGYSNLFYAATSADATEALAAATKSRLLFAGLTSVIPSGVSLNLQGDVRLISDITGDLINIFTVSGPTQVNGLGSAASYGGASGGCVDWLTGVVHGKHLMVGRTFIVPLYGGAYDSGTLSASTLTAMGTAAEAMRTASGPAFGVWGRPRDEKVRPGKPNLPALTGLWSAAISSRIPDKAVVLRSRRD